MIKLKILISFASIIGLLGCTNENNIKSYHFDKNGISKEVLENYLDRSITVTNILVPNKGETQLEDDIRMIKNTGAKFLGRSILV